MSDPAPQPTTSRWKLPLFACISVAILAALAHRVEWRAVGDAFASAKPMPLVAGILVTLLFPLLNTVRWMAVLRAVNVRNSFGDCLRITMATWPIGTLTPAKAGELLKALAVRQQAPLATGIGTTIAERVVDVGVLGAFGAIAGALTEQWIAAGIGAAALGAALLSFPAARFLLALLIRKKKGGKVREKLVGFLAVFPSLWHSPGSLALCAGASGLNWFLSMLQLWWLLAAFGAPASLGEIVAILPAATFAGLLPITVAGAGTRDAALLMLAQGRIEAAALLAASVVYTLTGYLFLGVLGLPFMHQMRERFAGTVNPP